MGKVEVPPQEEKSLKETENQNTSEVFVNYAKNRNPGDPKGHQHKPGEHKTSSGKRQEGRGG